MGCEVTVGNEGARACSADGGRLDTDVLPPFFFRPSFPAPASGAVLMLLSVSFLKEEAAEALSVSFHEGEAAEELSVSLLKEEAAEELFVSFPKEEAADEPPLPF